ncbi:hypothetical protein [Streptomyces xanthophaeus]|uniref:hypothetical protein n=1 Tax=Streptomyces xanthophaeus TaxID=67385 RepID=UPI003649770E
MEPDSRSSLESRADALMEALQADPEQLAATPSAASPGHPPEPVRQAHDGAAGGTR